MPELSTISKKTVFLSISAIGLTLLSYHFYKKAHKNNLHSLKKGLQKQCILLQKTNPDHSLHQTIKLLQILFKISMQTIVNKNQESRKQRRKCLLLLDGVEGGGDEYERGLKDYLSLLKKEFIRTKVVARDLFAEELRECGMEVSVLDKYAGNAEFVEAKKRLKENSLEGLQGISQLSISEFREIVNLQNRFLKTKGNHTIQSIANIANQWTKSDKIIILQAFSLILIDLTLLTYIFKDNDCQKLRDIDQIDIQYAKKKYGDEYDVMQQIQALEKSRTVYAKYLRQLLHF